MTQTSRKYFGTDGVRGPVGELLTPDLAVRLGRAAALRDPSERPQVLIVRDTRESGPMLEEALAAGIAAGGGDAMLGGVLPTPAASVLARRLSFDLAAVVSASHNPFADNGIKFFNSRGTKLDDDAELEIEGLMDEETGERVGGVRSLEGAFDDYIRELRTVFGLDLSGMRVALDCANGATFRAAPVIFQALGADLVLTGIEPDGRNINADCGSTHPENLIELVNSSGADIGFAYDGDGDRIAAVDGQGRLHDGDDLMALIALDLQRRGELEGGVAVTVMTNYGFMTTMEKAGIAVVQTQVGDRYVIEQLLERDWRLGGEQSGHIVWTDFTPTGDGIAASLLTLRALGGRPLQEVEPFERLPQRLENVRVKDRSAIEGATEVWDAVEEENTKLEGRGRVLVRPSGTEPLVRVMVEAPDEAECEAICNRLIEIVNRVLA
ncbi:MAG TPA: phosphoglucosamine mutase [Solirubrobacterales bacterium]|nr:phosphoglucosamine mutase [Solirubrobacterales bacterium]